MRSQSREEDAELVARAFRTEHDKRPVDQIDAD